MDTSRTRIEYGELQLCPFHFARISRADLVDSLLAHGEHVEGVLADGHTARVVEGGRLRGLLRGGGRARHQGGEVPADTRGVLLRAHLRSLTILKGFCLIRVFTSGLKIIWLGFLLRVFVHTFLKGFRAVASD